MKAVKVAIIATHPIQYQIPWFQKLAEHVDLKVYYALLPDPEQQGIGFGQAFNWDIPLLEGYAWQLIPNKRKSPSLRGFFSNNTPAILSLLARSKPDVAIITGWHSLPLLQSLWACQKLRIPCMVRGDSNAMRSRSLIIRLLHRYLLAQFDAFLFVGQSNQEFYQQYGITRDLLFPCLHFVDNNRFQEHHERLVTMRAAIRQSWGIPAERVCFLYVGKFEPIKRIFDLLEALDFACKQNPKLHLLMTGTGALMNQVQALVKDRGLPVTFTGFLNQNEIVQAYTVADCLILPSVSETWGLVVNEAMACGLPVVVSDRVGCWPDLVKEGITGSVFPFGNIGMLTERLLALAADPDKLAWMGQQARSHISNYSVEKAVSGTLCALEYVVAHREKFT